jgi:predicted O-linked N-acetylglucosamine transferase (SPINDLY family)
MAQNPNAQMQKAQGYLQNGNVPAALAILDGVLRKTPLNPDANHLLAMVHLTRGDAAGALAPLQLALKPDPQNGPLLDHLGLCYLMLGRFGDAEQVLRRAAALPRAPAVVVMRLGVALLHQQKTAQAVAVLERAVALAPREAECRMNLGRALHRAGQVEDARRAFDAALQLNPGHADTLFNQGVICLEQNELPDAAAWFDKAIASAPRHAEAWVNLGIVRERQRDLDGALAAHRKALEIEPRLPAAANNLAHVLSLMQRHDEARSQYLATLQFAPDFMPAREGLAAACLALGRIPEAITHLRVIVQGEPANHNAALALAKALLDTGQLDEAGRLAQRACELNPDSADAYATRATLFGVCGALDEAVGVLETGYARTGNGGLLGMLAFNYRQLCDWPKWERAWHDLAQRVDNDAVIGTLGSPFWLLCEPITPQQQRTYTEAWAAARYRNIQPLPPRAPPHAHERIRIGYLSSDLQEHAAAYLVADVLEHHDASRFEVFAYSDGPQDASPMRKRITAACEHFVDIAFDTDDTAAKRIRDDGIDILVDIKGYTVGDRITIMARRPCGIQVTWLGYPGTTGAPFVDYLIADPYIIRDGEQSTCTERVLRMPHCYQPNDRKRVVAQPLSRHEYGLPVSGFVFCCFNQTYKITPDVFAVWMRLLARVPGSVLWLVDAGATTRQNLCNAAREMGVAPERILFGPRRPYSEHLARYRVADLALDTFPYTSHTTLSDALWCGCPTVGLVGDTFAARVAGSILTAAGLEELICTSLANYQQLAMLLATDAGTLTQLRSKLVQARDYQPLFDSARFARDLEQLYEQMISERKTAG